MPVVLSLLSPYADTSRDLTEERIRSLVAWDDLPDRSNFAYALAAQYPWKWQTVTADDENEETLRSLFASHLFERLDALAIASTCDFDGFAPCQTPLRALAARTKQYRSDDRKEKRQGPRRAASVRAAPYLAALTEQSELLESERLSFATSCFRPAEPR